MRSKRWGGSAAQQPVQQPLYLEQRNFDQTLSLRIVIRSAYLGSVYNPARRIRVTARSCERTLVLRVFRSVEVSLHQERSFPLLKE